MVFDVVSCMSRRDTGSDVKNRQRWVKGRVEIPVRTFWQESRQRVMATWTRVAVMRW